MNKKLVKKIAIIVGIVLGVILLAVGSYVGYVLLSYDRLEDNIKLSVAGEATEDVAKLDTTYTIVSQNIGFGAYTADYTFFMDGGKESRAKSKDSVIECTDKALNTINAHNPDIILFQEVDTDSTRSYHVDQNKYLAGKLSGYSEAFAVNYHSVYLLYPVFEPHGSSNSGIGTFSKMAITSGLRRSVTVSDDFSKLFDLDRCYSISRINVENGKELVVFNVHMSAYGADASVRESQFTKLFGDMEKEYEAGNYVLCGGDFNADFTGDSVAKLNNGMKSEFGWTMPFPDEYLPKGINKCVNYKDGKYNPSARNTDIPYKVGNFTVIVDGFLASENVEVLELENVITGFEYSDHNPVCMSFVLK